MAFLKTYRLIIFTICIILSIPVLGLTSDLTHLTAAVNVVEGFEVTGLLASIVTLLLFPLLLVVSATRKNAFILYVIYELGIVGNNVLLITGDGAPLSHTMWLAVLWILWVVAAGLTIKKKNQLLGGFSCSALGEFSSEVEQKCNELVATEGIEIVTFVLLLKYMLVLFTYALVIYLRDGNSQVWFQTVEDMQGPEFPALTHKTGDLEPGIAGVPMTNYSTPAPATYNTPTIQ